MYQTPYNQFGPGGEPLFDEREAMRHFEEFFEVRLSTLNLLFQLLTSFLPVGRIRRAFKIRRDRRDACLQQPRRAP